MNNLKKIKYVMIVLSLLMSSFIIAQTNYEFEEYIPCNGLTDGIGGIEYGNPLIIDTYTSWTNQNLNEGVVIENGGTLIITGTVLMKKFIIVKPQGKLIVDGGTIKSGYGNESPWHGIYVYGDASLPQNTQYGLHLDNATIEQANVAIRVYGAYRCSGLSEENGGMGYSETLTQYNGGYVEAVNSSISDNSIGVHFKEYDYANLSRFEECDFASNGVSIIMDEVFDVLVDNCTIASSLVPYSAPDNLPSAEIVIRNSYAHIYNSDFAPGHYSLKDNAIYVSGTHPFIHRWSDLVMEIKGNHFSWQNNCIEVSGLVNTAYAIIDNNLFDDNSGAQNIIYYNGATVLNTTNNIMEYGAEGIHLKDAGRYKFAELSCNTYDDVYGIGIHAEGWNELLQMKNNDLNAGIGIYVNGEVEPEELNIPNQLKDGKPAMNCFQNDNGIDIKAEDNTPFRYYYPSGASPSSCYRPADGPGFDVKPSEYVTNGLKCNTPPNNHPEIITDEKADLLNDTLCILFDSMMNNPGDIDPKILWREFGVRYHEAIDPYLSKKANEGNFARVEQVLIDACEQESKEKLFGFYMSFKDYNKAQQVLDGMVRVGDAREQAFKDIEQIWLDWKQLDVKVPLTDQEVQTLTNVATMDIPERGFARGILASTMGIRIWDFDEPIEPRQAKTNDNIKDKIVELYPNPAKSDIVIGLNNNLDFSGKLLVIDLSGRTILSKKLDLSKGETTKINISNLTNGNYKAILIDNAGAIVGKSSFLVTKK